jgi:S1-C subfamily serine protease
LKVKGVFSRLSVSSDVSKLKLGATVFTVGFPNTKLQGVSPKVAKGEIAALAGPQDDSKYFQISLPVQPGNSGGPLVDEEGNVVGVVSAKLDEKTALRISGFAPENVNYAVKGSLLRDFLRRSPEVSQKLESRRSTTPRFEDLVKLAEDAAALVLVY